MSSLYPESCQVDPMRYGNKPSESVIEATWASGNWFAQEKKDGAWYQLEKTDSGHIYLFGRTKSKVTGEYTEKIDNVPHIKEWAEQLPNGTTLVGEIYVPGGKSNDVTKIMGCTAKNAYKRQFDTDEYGGPIHYYVFDIIRYAGKDLCDEWAYYRFYRYLIYRLGWLFEDNNPYVERAEIYEDNFEEHLKNIFAAGGEGMVFKNKKCPYRPGKRTTTSQMYKYKEHMDSVDLVCTGLLDPVWEYTGKEIENWPYWMERGECTSDNTFDWIPCGENCYKDSLSNPHIFKPVTKPAYYGWKNAMQLGAFKDGKIVDVGRVASGFTDEDRQNMAERPEDYLGKVVEVECMSTTKDGALRHPVFKRVREDKGPNDCLWNEIF